MGHLRDVHLLELEREGNVEWSPETSWKCDLHSLCLLPECKNKKINNCGQRAMNPRPRCEGQCLFPWQSSEQRKLHYTFTFLWADVEPKSSRSVSVWESVECEARRCCNIWTASMCGGDERPLHIIRLSRLVYGENIFVCRLLGSLAQQSFESSSDHDSHMETLL